MNMKKYQCYYNETLLINGREYVGKRINTECFNSEEEAEKYCIGNVGIQEFSNGSYRECEMNYDEIIK
jgi:hypothetical protein